MKFPKSKLIDARNWGQLKDQLIEEIRGASKVGLDIETCDPDRHEGLNRFMKVNDEGKKAGNKPLVFDIKRTVVTGFSHYCQKADVAYYLNLNHADVENRIPWKDARIIIDEILKRPASVAHNAPFERTMFKECYDLNLGKNVICSMQLAVTAFNDDTYDIEDLKAMPLTGLRPLIPAIKRAYKDYRPGKKLTSAQEELLFKVIAKESDAAHSIAGMVKTIAYRYGLKGLSKKFLGYTQTTFAEVLNGKAHMGELTGEEVVAYGADDAWCAVWVAEKLVEYIKRRSPKVLSTFVTQENPMTQVYSDVWSGGLRIDIDAVKRAQVMEREKAAQILRVMKKGVKALLPFKDEPHEKLKKYDKWFYQEKEVTNKEGETEIIVKEGYKRYRQLIEDWANTPDSEDSFEQLYQVRSAISNAWAEDKGLKPSKAVNLNHYMPVRTILYDLCGFSYIQANGKTQSNGEAQETMRERWVKKHGEVKGDASILVLDCMRHLSASEQNIKLYVTNYLNLTDPETGRMYPTLNSLLNTRRMALSFPNVSQLPKNGYVRGFFLGDTEDHLVISADFSSQEMLLIGEASGDERFKEAFGQLPYEDLHSVAAAGCMDISVEELKARPDYKSLRKAPGKTSNFEFWFSNFLGNTGKTMGWTLDEIFQKTKAYRDTFPGGIRWREREVRKLVNRGELELPDHHKRYRFEATHQWANIMQGKFASVGLTEFGKLVIKRVQTRAKNQGINALIQGAAATMGKRTILNLGKMVKEKLYKARLMFPVHDELVESCHQDQAFDFIKDFRVVMCDHPDLIKTLVIDATVAIGRNFGAYDAKSNKYGQIELDEYNGPKELGLTYGSKLNDEGVKKVIDYLKK